MTSTESKPLTQRKCKACEGGVEKLTATESSAMLEQVSKWAIEDSGDCIERKWTFKNFVQTIQFVNQVAELAETEQHHPDLHITGYRHLRIVLTTHAIGGLSENDFIVAAKIDQLV